MRESLRARVPTTGIWPRRRPRSAHADAVIDAMKPPELKPERVAIGRARRNAPEDQQEGGRATYQTWTTKAAGLPCTIKLADDGCWVVTIASATTSRREDLTAAILEASGGLVSNAEAIELAASVKDAGHRRPGPGGTADAPAVVPDSRGPVAQAVERPPLTRKDGDRNLPGPLSHPAVNPAGSRHTDAAVEGRSQREGASMKPRGR